MNQQFKSKMDAQIFIKFYGTEHIYTRYCVKNFEENQSSSFTIKFQKIFEEGAVMKKF